MDDKALCPLVDVEIEDIDCIETRDAVDGLMLERSIPAEYKQKEGWKEICRKCKYHNY